MTYIACGLLRIETQDTRSSTTRSFSNFFLFGHIINIFIDIHD